MEQDGGTHPNARLAATQPPPRPSAVRIPHRITLAQPRPGMTRRQNDYIETPLRPQLPSKCSKARLKEEYHATTIGHFDGAAVSRSGIPDIHRPTTGLFKSGTQLPITAQPTVVVFKKEKPPDTLPAECTEDQHQESIICRHCGRCKCEACRSPRHLPSRWICNNKCLCSAQAAVDYCSCVCCVKGVFYHWAKDYEMDTDVSCADEPCSCSPHQRVLRWGCLAILSLPFPCLCCYWPLRGCVKSCEVCYTHCTAHGCRCSPQHRTAMRNEQRAPEKRLLDTNSDC